MGSGDYDYCLVLVLVLFCRDLDWIPSALAPLVLMLWLLITMKWMCEYDGALIGLGVNAIGYTEAQN